MTLHKSSVVTLSLTPDTAPEIFTVAVMPDTEVKVTNYKDALAIYRSFQAEKREETWTG